MLSLYKFPGYFWYSLPVLWFLGVDQVVVIPFILSFSLLVVFKFKVLIKPDFIEWAFLFIALWCLLSLPNVTNIGLWLKYFLAFFCSFLYLYSYRILCLLSGGVGEGFIISEFNRRGFFVFILFSVFLLLVYLVSPSFSFRTLIGYVIHSDSYFVQSLTSHSVSASFDEYDVDGYRLSGPFVSYSSMSMAVLLLIPMAVVYFRDRILNKILIVSALTLMLILTESRLALVAYCFFVLLLFYFVSLNRFPAGRFWLVFGVFVFIFGSIYTDLYSYVYDMLFGVRSASVGTRGKIYYESIIAISEYPIVGWGNSNPLEMSSQRFSAGTHSSYIAMAYQHGLIALGVYIGLWLGVLYLCMKKFFSFSGVGVYSVVMCAGMVAFFIREAFDIWWWDQILLFIFLNFICIWRDSLNNKYQINSKGYKQDRQPMS